MFVYECDGARAPMIVSWPGHLPAERTRGALAPTICLAPTLLDLALRSVPESIGGVSLVAVMNGPRRSGTRRPRQVQCPWDRRTAQTYFPLFNMNWAPLRTLQDQRWKFIDAPGARTLRPPG